MHDVSVEPVREYIRPARGQKRLPLIGYELPEKVAAIVERRRFKKRKGKHKPRRVCRYCGKLLAKKLVTLDHIVPTSRGGADHPRNYALACTFCQHSKANMLPEEWAARILSVVHMRPVAIGPPEPPQRSWGVLGRLAAAVGFALPLVAKGGGH